MKVVWQGLCGLVIFTTLSLSACSSSSNDGPSCDTRSEAQCIDSAECTLVLAGEPQGSYGCVEARNDCEDGFIQRTGDAASCEQEQGCKFVPGSCYCAPGLNCVCGGGPPPQCEPSEG